MRVYLLDTSVIIDFLKDKKFSVELIRNLQGELTSSTICLAELSEGVYRSHDRKLHEQTLTEFFYNLSDVYAVDEQIAKKFGELRARLKKQGEVIEDFDLLIAATCVVYDLILITLNKRHFSRIKELQILGH